MWQPGSHISCLLSQGPGHAAARTPAGSACRKTSEPQGMAWERRCRRAEGQGASGLAREQRREAHARVRHGARLELC